jgi:hypothetical protein
MNFELTRAQLEAITGQLARWGCESDDEKIEMTPFGTWPDGGNGPVMVECPAGKFAVSHRGQVSTGEPEPIPMLGWKIEIYHLDISDGPRGVFFTTPTALTVCRS